MAYCAQADIEAIWGVNNVSSTTHGSWADMDNDGNATKIAARIAQAVAHADEIVNSRMRSTPYKLDLTTAAGATPVLITHVAAVLAGLWLYEARGKTDVGDAGIEHAQAFWKKWAYGVLEEIATGKLRLDAVVGR